VNHLPHLKNSQGGQAGGEKGVNRRKTEKPAEKGVTEQGARKRGGNRQRFVEGTGVV